MNYKLKIKKKSIYNKLKHWKKISYEIIYEKLFTKIWNLSLKYSKNMREIQKIKVAHKIFLDFMVFSRTPSVLSRTRSRTSRPRWLTTSDLTRNWWTSRLLSIWKSIPTATSWRAKNKGWTPSNPPCSQGVKSRPNLIFQIVGNHCTKEPLPSRSIFTVSVSS